MKSVNYDTYFYKNSIVPLPGPKDLYSLAKKTMEHLPKKYKRLTSNILIKIENFSDNATLEGLEIKDKYDLLGLYRGIPIPTKTKNKSIPNYIFLYRCPLIRYARENQESLEHLVHHVMIHEIGHHFGFNSYDLSWIENKHDLP